MTTIKSYTDINQSKRLAEILPLESADNHYIRKVTDFRGNPVDGEWSHPKYGNPNSKYADYIVQNFTSYEKLPCWSLAALLEIIPRELKIILAVNDYWDGNAVKYKYAIGSVEHNNYDCYADNHVDACYELILKLNKLNLL